LVVALKAAVTTKPPVKGQPRGKTKGKRRRETFDTVGTEAERAGAGAKAEQEANWGLLEPLRGPLSPFVSLLGPVFSTQIIIPVLLVLLIQSWFFGPIRGGRNVGYRTNGSDRMAGYEAMWRAEENDLWDWLEDRIGLEQGMGGPLGQSDVRRDSRQKILRSRQMGKRLETEKMGEREVDDAIKITEDRLEALKEAVHKRKEKRQVKN